MFGESSQIKGSLSRLEAIAGVVCIVLKIAMGVFICLWLLFFLAAGISLISSFQGWLNAFMIFLLLAPVVTDALISVYILYTVIRIFSLIRKGESPFTNYIAKQISIISVLLLVSFFLGALISVIPADGYSLGVMTIGVSKQGEGIIADLKISTLVAASIGFGLSYVFKYGALLQQLSDDTV